MRGCRTFGVGVVLALVFAAMGGDTLFGEENAGGFQLQPQQLALVLTPLELTVTPLDLKLLLLVPPHRMRRLVSLLLLATWFCVILSIQMKLLLFRRSCAKILRRHHSDREILSDRKHDALILF